MRVAGVVPIAGAADDPDLTPDYPGITEATNVIDWDPPFPVDLELIRPADETTGTITARRRRRSFRSRPGNGCGRRVGAG